jgi:hypothetical protein
MHFIIRPLCILHNPYYDSLKTILLGYLVFYLILTDRLCDVVGRVPSCRPRGQGSIPGSARYSEKLYFWNGVLSGS